MHTATQPSLPTSLMWIEVTPPANQKFWARTTRALEGSSQPEKEAALALLKEGRKIAYETSGITLQCAPMPSTDQKRLEHLLGFEECGFRLATFRHDMALFYRDNEDHYSMNEMAERGFLPTSAIAINPGNVPITTLDGHLVDVFVPVALGPINFFQAHAY